MTRQEQLYWTAKAADERRAANHEKWRADNRAARNQREQMDYINKRAAQPLITGYRVVNPDHPTRPTVYDRSDAGQFAGQGTTPAGADILGFLQGVAGTLMGAAFLLYLVWPYLVSAWHTAETAVRSNEAVATGVILCPVTLVAVPLPKTVAVLALTACVVYFKFLA